MPQIVPAAQRALQVFEYFALEGRPLKNSELARHLGLADSSCSDLLHTLREAGYLLRTPKSRFFHPTTRLHDLSQRMAAKDPLQAFTTEALELLSARTCESSMCGLLDGAMVKIFACHESPLALRYVLRPGVRVGLHSTALGKAMLGAMPAQEREALIDQLNLEPVTAATLQDGEALRSEVADGAARGWFLARDEGAEGVMALGIAGAIDGRLTALSVVGPTHRMSENLAAHIEVMLAARKAFF